eukprot:SAG11_NODE_106_length_16423_cov_51.220840_16_plen_87_part_00
MRLVLLGGESLDELEQMALRSFDGLKTTLPPPASSNTEAGRFSTGLTAPKQGADGAPPPIPWAPPPPDGESASAEVRWLCILYIYT